MCGACEPLVKIGTDGRVPIGTQRCAWKDHPGSKVVLWLHPTGHHSVLAAAPDPKQKPVLLFTNRLQITIPVLLTTKTFLF